MKYEVDSVEYTGPWSNNISAMIDIPTFSFAKLSVGDLSIQDNKDWYIYNPQEDITTYELSLLLRLFVIAVGASGYSYDYWRFVKSYGLERHFKKKENG